MCNIDWIMLGDMLSGIGTLLVGIAAMLTLLFQFGYRAKSSKLEKHLMRIMYSKYMACEEGIVWSDYTKDSQQIIRSLSKETGLEEKFVKQLLDQLKKEGKI
ncbi:MAG: hypothetical protein ACI9ZT_000062 [Gammaproteobacteria bacterium]|jgi:hypothetical protein